MTEKAKPSDAITCLVLCGGAARRMGGVDKPLELWRGKTLVEHALSRLPVGLEVLVSANRNLARYGELGWPVITDKHSGAQPFAGPLAGIAAAAPHVQSPWLYVVPGDAPLLPADLAWAMLAACETQDALACCARTERRQPLPMLVAAGALEQLPDYLKRGDLSVGGWLGELNAIELNRETDAAAFANFNTLADLEQA